MYPTLFEHFLFLEVEYSESIFLNEINSSPIYQVNLLCKSVLEVFWTQWQTLKRGKLQALAGFEPGSVRIKQHNQHVSQTLSTGLSSPRQK